MRSFTGIKEDEPSLPSDEPEGLGEIKPSSGRKKDKPFAPRKSTLDKNKYGTTFSIMDNLMEHVNSLSEKELADNISTFVIAGTETTSMALCWWSLRLGRDQDLQERLRKEAFANPSNETKEEVLKWNLLRASWRETLRLHVPTPVLLNRLMKEIEILGKKDPCRNRNFTGVRGW